MVWSNGKVMVQLVAIIASAICCSCAQKAQEENYLAQWDGKELAQIEQIASYELLPAYKVAAYSGSGSAANALSTFYMKADKTGEQEFYWDTIAAENGDPVGQFNLAQQYLNKESLRYSPHRAQFWLKKAAQQGDSDAVKMLGEISTKASSSK